MSRILILNVVQLSAHLVATRNMSRIPTFNVVQLNAHLMTTNMAQMYTSLPPTSLNFFGFQPYID